MRVKRSFYTNLFQCDSELKRKKKGKDPLRNFFVNLTWTVQQPQLLQATTNFSSTPIPIPIPIPILWIKICRNYRKESISEFLLFSEFLKLHQTRMSFQDLEAGRPFLKSQQQPKDSSQLVAAGIFQINTAIYSFNRLVSSLGTPKDTIEFREKLHKTRLRIGELVKDTSAKLRQASETDRHEEVSPVKKINDAKLAKEFRTALNEFQKAQRLAAERETTYAPFVPKEILPSSYNAYDSKVSSSRVPEQQSLLLDSKRQEIVLLDNEVVFNEALIEEREQGIKEIQQQITEVNEIFKDLAVLVHEQGVMIDDIGSNIENSHTATVQATSHLRQASKTQKSNSSLLCLLLVIFGIILIIVVIVVVA
ncbi:syntaxin-22-like [Mercurialis annua]|uniref:syntaxin-22-like n=1 Tax=Mercurialis annua TaxID=3986 RepID=UPI0021606322|nr:syntaxin-22-like [Mercurialis annua]